ncbi:MAG TPA: L,D-transpeptidase family protein [Sphingobium sp.]
MHLSFPRSALRTSLALLIAGLFAIPAAAQALVEARALKVGQFLWDAEAENPVGDLSITISIAQQRIYVYRGGRLIGMSTVSTGTRGHATPLGDFTILQKRQWHRSNLYSNAPMPYMQRLTWTGIAIHAGHLPGYPASHGCIRLPTAFAKQLFAITSMGVPVTIVGAKREPLVKLQFADIEWLAGDDMLTAPPLRQAPVVSDGWLVEGTRMPVSSPVVGPHWASPAEIEGVRSGRMKPRLEFEAVPE